MLALARSRDLVGTQIPRSCHEIDAISRSQLAVNRDELGQIVVHSVEIGSRFLEDLSQLAHDLERRLMTLPLVLIDPGAGNGGVNPGANAQFPLRQAQIQPRLLESFRDRVAGCVARRQRLRWCVSNRAQLRFTKNCLTTQSCLVSGLLTIVVECRP